MPNISILDEINSSNFSTIRSIYQPTAGHSGFVTALGLTINLKSIPAAEFPYIPDETPPDVIEQIFRDLEETLQFKTLRILLKKGSGAWVLKATIKIFNKEPFYEIDLMPYYSKGNTIDVADDLSLGIQLLTGNTLAPNIDRILIFGSAIEEKKNNGNEELAERIEVLESLINTKAPISNSLQLTQRSFSDGGPFNANTWITPSFAAIKWVDATYTNLYVPIQSGMIFQFDSLHSTSTAGKYRVQYYYSGTRFFCRTESNGTWNAWREFSTVAV